MKDEIQKTQQRTLQYWLVDGLSEIAFGGLSLLLGFYFYSQATLPQESWLYTILNTGFVVIIIVGAFLMNRFVVAVKTRLTYPRTGYVSYRRETGSKRWLRIFVAFSTAALTSSLFTLALSGNRLSLDWMPAAMGVIFSVTLLITAWRTAVLRFTLLAGGALIWGASLTFLGVGNSLGLAYFYLGMCLLVWVSGGCTLVYYFHSTAPAEMNDE